MLSGYGLRASCVKTKSGHLAHAYVFLGLQHALFDQVLPPWSNSSLTDIESLSQLKVVFRPSDKKHENMLLGGGQLNMTTANQQELMLILKNLVVSDYKCIILVLSYHFT